MTEAEEFNWIGLSQWQLFDCIIVLLVNIVDNLREFDCCEYLLFNELNYTSRKWILDENVWNLEANHHLKRKKSFFSC